MKHGVGIAQVEGAELIEMEKTASPKGPFVGGDSDNTSSAVRGLRRVAMRSGKAKYATHALAQAWRGNHSMLGSFFSLSCDIYMLGL